MLSFSARTETRAFGSNINEKVMQLSLSLRSPYAVLALQKDLQMY